MNCYGTGSRMPLPFGTFLSARRRCSLNLVAQCGAPVSILRPINICATDVVDDDDHNVDELLKAMSIYRTSGTRQSRCGHLDGDRCVDVQF